MPLPRRPRPIPRIPKGRQLDVTRAEFNRVIEILNRRGEIIEEYGGLLEQIRRDLDVQFKRTAQLQAEVDGLKKARTLPGSR
jgi:hypothetical protein